MHGQDTTWQPLGARYRLGARIASGAIGTVHRAHDLHEDVPVAVKLLRPESAEQPDLVEGLLTEARLLSRLDHPNVIGLRDRVVDGDRPALVLDLIDGDDLRRRVRRDGPLPPAVAVDIAAQLATALAYLHERDIVHGDVKPANLLVPADGGRVRLIDFGAARIGSVAPADRSTLGTPEYVAPEIVAGEPATAATDVYALGIVLFELLCGRSPYRGGPADEVLARHRRCVPVPPPGLPQAVWPVIEQCLAAEAAGRPAAGLLAARLRGLEPTLDGRPALPALPADAVTWWPRGGAQSTVTGNATVGGPRSTAGGAAAAVPAAAGGRAAPPAGPAGYPGLPGVPVPLRRRLLRVGGAAGGGAMLLATVIGLTLAAGQQPPVVGRPGADLVPAVTATGDPGLPPGRAAQAQPGASAASPDAAARPDAAAAGPGVGAEPGQGGREPAGSAGQVGASGQVGSSGSAGSGASVGSPESADPGAQPSFPGDPGGELGIGIGDPVPQWPVLQPAGSDTPN
ncbi:serine/threonine-protein kinase [Micromonospora sp. NBC_01813]|uniref:serine/threonine-protein kinase n=1 Tax=Micromonospora sp. NBC_01813 TaxID=2975988 RepID=UPI002DDBEC0E|nr:serine/threonine-protein kinase [Micromonospora sp. NBC_01813]WSA08464.1 serine/threonine protein kinase [Micromonospora sp. NBC_01813]